MEIKSGDSLDFLVGSSVENGIIVSGECALQRCGLTSYLSDNIKAWTLYPEISGVQNSIVSWYFNPFAVDYIDTKSSSKSENIKIPSKERAIVEYVMFHDYFDEGILIEGLKNYLYEMGGDTSKLYEEAGKFHLKEDLLAYWIKEAIEDEDD